MTIGRGVTSSNSAVGKQPKFKIGDKVSVLVRFGEAGVVKEIKDGRYGVKFYNMPLVLWYDENEIRLQVGLGFSWCRPNEESTKLNKL